MRFCLTFLLGGCSFYVKAWEKHGDCAIVCDYEMGTMTQAWAVRNDTCSCYVPSAAEYNRMRPVSPMEERIEITCDPDCETIANKITRRQPWRKH
jgi:hypothetical protein